MIPFKNISPETTYFVLGIGATVLASLTRTIRRKGFFSRIGFFRWIVDAVTCTLISSGISLSVHEYFQCSFVYTIAIGTFVGSLGSQLIISLLTQFIRKKLGVRDED